MSGHPAADPFDLARFVSAQEPVYEEVLSELRAGLKRTHWMWFVFPQVAGLGVSSTSIYYAISGLEEARAYLAHPVLGARLLECMRAVLGVEGRTAHDVFGSPDDLKFRSSMTLFELVSEPGSPFAQALDKYYGGERDAATLRLVR